MITPFGRYRWARLPFGLKVSSEIFQRKLNEALSGLNSVICVADDLLVMGSGNTREEADSGSQSSHENSKISQKTGDLAMQHHHLNITSQTGRRKLQ